MSEHRYALLILPAANRVYAAATAALTRAELGVFNLAVFGGRLGEPAERSLGGVRYLEFSGPELSERDRGFLANLSSVYALYRVEGELLRPLDLPRLDRLDDDLVTIPKYRGKTNEYFTKLLLNVTVLSSAAAPDMLDRPLRVLDPLCGRGTTLNQALMYGYHAAGVDLDGKDFDAYAAFVRTWLTRKRLQHTAEVGPVRRNRRVLARRLDVTFGLTREQFRAGDVQRLTVVHADTLQAADHLPAGSFDVLVTDAPYGVQHGSRPRGRPLTRNPIELIAEALPGWLRLLRPGAAVGISWNANVGRRDQLAAVLADAGLDVFDVPPYTDLRHRVDQAIVRDVLVATVQPSAVQPMLGVALLA